MKSRRRRKGERPGSLQHPQRGREAAPASPLPACLVGTPRCSALLEGGGRRALPAAPGARRSRGGSPQRPAAASQGHRAGCSESGSPQLTAGRAGGCFLHLPCGRTKGFVAPVRLSSACPHFFLPSLSTKGKRCLFKICFCTRAVCDGKLLQFPYGIRVCGGRFLL